MGWRKYKVYAYEKYGVKVTEAEAREFRERFFQKYPDLLVWHAKMRRIVAQTGYVVSPIGRKRRLPEIYSSDSGKSSAAEREAINSPVQGFASDYVVSALIWINKMLKANYPDYKESLKIFGGVHDSIFFEIREDKIDFWAPKIKKWYEDPTRLKEWFGYDLPIPIPGDIKVFERQYGGKVLFKM